MARRAAAGRRRPARVGEATSPPRIPSIKGEKGIAAQLSPSTNGAFASGSPSKATRGSTWDRVLNIHHTLTFSGAGGLNVAGPQT
ncbi:hypothetical protein AQ726_02890 [Burkholderia pseudomallei]|nr:hypothetical protein AQ726_02890 [Burkholderia pseudomallei]